ncbi:MAG TPA: DinB family protein [Candidatus Kapabacteria bacterium]|nr:DinB family protein [Candidatus Kapabacteria bacterium]
MTFTEYCRDFLDYDRWATRRTIESLRGLAGPDEGLRLLGHLLAARSVWLVRISGGDTSLLTVWPEWSLAECEERLNTVHAEWSAYLGTLDDGAIDSLRTYRTIAGAEFSTSLRDILTQVNNHGTYHRGQIARIVRERGGMAASTDFIFYARAGRGEA